MSFFYETGISKTDRVEQTAQTISNLIIGNDDYQAFYMELLRMDNIEVRFLKQDILQTTK